MRRVTFVVIVIAYLLLIQSSDVLAKEVPFTLEDRDRLIRVEAKLEEIDKRFEQIDKRFDQLVSIFIGIVAAFAGIVAVTIGFAIWDRKTALAPAMRRSQELEERVERIERVLKESAEKEPGLAEILRHVGIL